MSSPGRNVSRAVAGIGSAWLIWCAAGCARDRDLGPPAKAGHDPTSLQRDRMDYEAGLREKRRSQDAQAAEASR